VRYSAGYSRCRYTQLDTDRYIRRTGTDTAAGYRLQWDAAGYRCTVSICWNIVIDIDNIILIDTGIQRGSGQQIAGYQGYGEIQAGYR